MYVKPREKQNLSSPVKGPTRFASTPGSTEKSTEAPPLLHRSNSNLKELSKRAKKVSASVMDLAGNLQAMKSVCVNYGLAAALILTMTFANYAAIGSDALD